MKTAIAFIVSCTIAIFVLMPIAAVAQDVVMTEEGIFDVPLDKQVVLIPKDLPQQCKVVCKADVMYIGTPQPEVVDPEVVYCDEVMGLQVSPFTCVVRDE